MIESGPTSFDPLAAVRPLLDTPLSRILAERVQRDGPISFADWMDVCLYHPQHGYYRRGQPTVGRDGDFLTSPEVHPIFGAAIGHVAIELWRRCGEPRPFEIAEVGPGTGSLAEALLRQLHAAEPRLADAARYTLVEPDSVSAQRQCARLRSLHSPQQTRWISSVDELGGGYFILANELIDALPVHRLKFDGGRWRELLVGYSPTRGFHDQPADVTDDRLLTPLRDFTPSEGQIVEVAPERSAMVTALARAVTDNSLLLLFDYGYPRERLYAPWRRDGTLMTFRNHIPGDDPYAHPGEQDISVHIDIDQVREAACQAGLTPLPALSQSEWLHQLGAATLPAVADAETDTNRYLAARRAVETLADPAGLGRIAVMGFTRGALDTLPGWSEP